MPKRLVIDSQRLLELVNKEVPQKEIMSQLGIKTPAQFKTAYLNALIDTGKVKPPITSRSGGGQTEAVSREIQVNKRGSLVIPKALVEDMGFKVGEKFSVRKSRVGLSIKKAD